LRETAREAIRAVRALEALADDVDVFGSYVVRTDEQLDVDEVVEFLYLAREMHPHQELTLTVTAQTREDNKEEHDGNSEGVRHRAEDR
jgi:hypothetical protein